MSSQPVIVSSLATALPPSRPRRMLLLTATPAASSSSGLASRDRARIQPRQQPSCPRLVAAQSPPPLAPGIVQRDAKTGLAFLLLVLSVVMSSFLSLAILSIPTLSSFRQMEIAAHKLLKIVAEEVPETLSSLKLSCLEINDLTSQLKNLRQRLTMDGFGKKSSTEERSHTGIPNQRDI